MQYHEYVKISDTNGDISDAVQVALIAMEAVTVGMEHALVSATIALDNAENKIAAQYIINDIKNVIDQGNKHILMMKDVANKAEQIAIDAFTVAATYDE